jgi:sec-independent protein translocase protein TatA
MPFGFQPTHLLVIVVIALVVFGPQRLPEIGRGLGKAIIEFRKGARELTEGFQSELNGSSSTTANPPAWTPVRQPNQIASGGSRQFCIYCGTPNAADARFCNQCGGRLPVKDPVVDPVAQPTADLVKDPVTDPVEDTNGQAIAGSQDGSQI